MLHRCNVREWEWEGTGKALWESHGDGNWLQNWEWEWEGMGIDCTGMGGSGNVKSHSRASLISTINQLTAAAAAAGAEMLRRRLERDETDTVRRSSADVFPASPVRGSCVRHADDLHGRHSTTHDVLDQSRTSWSTATQNTLVVCTSTVCLP